MQNNRFLRFGDTVIAINHIVSAYRHQNGDVTLDLIGDGNYVRVLASAGQAQPLWAWLTSAINTTTLPVQQAEPEPTAL